MRIVCEKHLISLNPVIKVLLKCVIRFSTSFRWYAFSNFCSDISRALAYGMRMKASRLSTELLAWPSFDIHCIHHFVQ